ncbi:ATP-binding protein [Marinomonas sp. A3A]|uniref:sensor histidine kinase n=1 Tax=Marinomonas sp. A3A TaxID=2065312 RepID=UPI001BB2FD0C|nr:ATP-binding protein [Marinomonas sp. A3A]
MLCLNRIIKNSLKFRLIITFVTALTVLVSGTYTYLFVLNPNILIEHILNKQVDFIVDDIVIDSHGKPYISQEDNERSNWIYLTLKDDIFYQIIDEDGGVFSASSNSSQPFTTDNMPYNARTTHFTFTHHNAFFYALNRPLDTPFDGYTLQVATSLRLLDVFQITNISPISKTVLLVSLLSLLIVCFAVIATIHFMLHPLRRASEVASKITPQNLQGRLSITGMPEELVPLISALNAALERLEQGYKVQQEFLATAAHELKTPLSLIRGEIEMLEGVNSKNIMLKDVDHISRQIHQLLHLAEVRESHNYAFQKVALMDVVYDVTHYLSRLAKTHDTSIQVHDDTKSIHLNADPSTLFILLKNLIENAIYHSPADIPVDITITNNALVIRDYGEGIDEQHMALLFDRFWRAPKQKISGAGLGLAICLEIASIHGWKIAAYNSSPGASFVLYTSPQGPENELTRIPT